MTYDDVANAAATLEAEGLTPSGNNVLMHLKQRDLRGSKRTSLHFLIV